MTVIDVCGKKYQLQSRIGTSMQFVYRARSSEGERAIVKFAEGPNGSEVEAMTREVHALRRLDHPGIVRLLGASWERDAEAKGLAGVPALIVEPRGTSLEQLLKQRGRIDQNRVLPILEQVSAALDYQHEQGIIHRDIKPHNVVVDKGLAALIDYGVCWSRNLAFLDEPGMAYGTLLYMSPDQCAAVIPSPRDDQFALSFTAYEVLTGKRARVAHYKDEAMAQLYNLLPPATKSNARVSAAASDVLTRAAHPVAAERFESCREFYEQLKYASTKTVRRAA